ncbi:MAG: hypothetical protein HYY52_07095 [Candidatus Melainabacteria bacterium]|nr:hypothetical protein [Candidatus Melainabacteria bacterium]
MGPQQSRWFDPHSMEYTEQISYLQETLKQQAQLAVVNQLISQGVTGRGIKLNASNPHGVPGRVFFVSGDKDNYRLSYNSGTVFSKEFGGPRLAPQGYFSRGRFVPVGILAYDPSLSLPKGTTDENVSKTLTQAATELDLEAANDEIAQRLKDGKIKPGDTFTRKGYTGTYTARRDGGITFEPEGNGHISGARLIKQAYYIKDHMWHEWTPEAKEDTIPKATITIPTQSQSPKLIKEHITQQQSKPSRLQTDQLYTLPEIQYKPQNQD